MQTQTDYVEPTVEKAPRSKKEKKQRAPELCNLEPGDYLSVCGKNRELSFLGANGGGVIPWDGYNSKDAYKTVFGDRLIAPDEAKLIFWHQHLLMTEATIVNHETKSFALKVSGQKYK